MDNSSNDSSISFNFIAIITVFCCFFAFLASQFLFPVKSRRSNGVGVSLKNKNCSCICSCCGGKKVEEEEVSYTNGGIEENHEVMPVRVSERQTGASMMEQLVPEITTHALSYLDYPSLCRLSMTNSSMRRAANDDSAWKVLYQKDFTVEQDSVVPVNGWKAYYAATRAVVNANTNFYNMIREQSLPAMSRLWLNADYVKCIHDSGELFSGYEAVMGSWQLAFNWGQPAAFEVRDVRARVLTEMAWVTLKAYIDMMEFNVTNVFEFHKGQWYMVSHHTSVVLIDAEAANHQNMFE